MLVCTGLCGFLEHVLANNELQPCPPANADGTNPPPPPQSNCVVLKTVATLPEQNPFEVRTKELEGQWLGGHDFNKAAHFGMRGSGHLHLSNNPETQALAERLKNTSENLDTAGQVGRVGTYAGYGAGAASIGAATINYINRKRGPNETAAEISDIASKASFGVGAANLSTGAYGWWISRKYDKEGYEKAAELQRGLEKNSPAYENLEAAKKHFKEARVKAKEAALDMVINGAANVAVGGAALAVKQKVEKTQELQSLGNNGGTISTAATGNSATSTNPYDPNSLGSGNGSNSGTSGSTNNTNNTQPTLINTFAPQTPARGVTGLTGGSVAPSPHSPGTNKLAAAHSAGGVGIAGGAPSPDGEEENPSHSAESPVEASDAGSEYSNGGRGLSNVSSTDDESNPIASVFGQLTQMVTGNKSATNVNLSAGNTSSDSAATPVGLRGNASEDEADPSDAPEIFRSVKKKLFKMKFGGNI